MQSGPGRLLVGAIGLVVLGVGAYLVYKGATKKFLEDLTGTGGHREVSTAIRYLGMVGYIAKGIAVAVLGGLFVYAAAQADASEATGLDGAFRTIGEQPFGQVLLRPDGPRHRSKSCCSLLPPSACTCLPGPATSGCSAASGVAVRRWRAESRHSRTAPARPPGHQVGDVARLMGGCPPRAWWLRWVL